MNMNKICCGLIVCIFSFTLQAAEIVNWGNSSDYVSTNPVFNFSGQTSGNFWRSGPPADVTPLTDYIAPVGKTNDIFAVFQQETPNSTKTHVGLRMVENSVSDFMQIQGQNPGSGQTTTLSGLVYFTQAGFLNNFDTGTLSIATVESIKLTLTGEGDGSSGTGGLRMAIQNNGTWYLSESTTGLSASTTTYENLGSMDWAAWDPNTFPIDTQPSSFNVSGSTLTDIEAFGFYYNVSREGGAPRLHYQGFEVIAIPEPGTLMLVGIALGSLLLFRRKR